MGDYRQGSKLIAPIRPTITIPPKSSTEALFMGASPGAMTILSNFLSDNFPEAADFRVSFSELLAGAMASPAGGGVCEGYKENRPAGLAVSPGMFAVSPGFSPSAFLSSPTFFSPAALSPFGMTHQQALAQVTAKAAQPQPQPQPQPHLGIQSEHHLPLLGLTLPMTSSSMAPSQHMSELPEASNSERRPPCFPLPVDKPADDGYNWRKYGQKQVKASEYPRSYYRCTNLDCPVKKKVERSFDGHITEIIYKGQHNHDPPQRNKRGKDDCSVVAVGDHGSQVQAGNFLWSGGLGRDQDSAQATSMQLHGPSDSEDSGDAYQQVEDDDDDETNPKIRKTGMGSSDVPFSHKTVTEPKIVVQTKSEVDLLDDGYRWRKYGQKVVKGNPNPRSYYKCTTAGCNVRKHVERASTDLKSVITTYEGKHSHDVPAARGSSTATADTGSFPAKQNAFDDKHTSLHQMDQRSMGLLRLKEEQIVM